MRGFVTARADVRKAMGDSDRRHLGRDVQVQSVFFGTMFAKQQAPAAHGARSSQRQQYRQTIPRAGRAEHVVTQYSFCIAHPDSIALRFVSRCIQLWRIALAHFVSCDAELTPEAGDVVLVARKHLVLKFPR